MKTFYYLLLSWVWIPCFLTAQISSNNVLNKELICKIPTEQIFIKKANQLSLKKEEFVSEFSIAFFTIINDTFNIINSLEKNIVKISKMNYFVKYEPMPKAINDLYYAIDSNCNYYTSSSGVKFKVFDKSGNILFIDSIASTKFKITDNNAVYQGKWTYFRDKNKTLKPHSIKHLDPHRNSDYYLKKDNFVIIKGGDIDDDLVFMKYNLNGELITSKTVKKWQEIYDIIILNYNQIKQEYLVFAGNSNDKDLPQLLTINDNGDILSHISLQKDKTDWGKIVSAAELHYLMPDGLTYHYELKENALYVLEMDRSYLYISKYKL